jgi:uncharacterized protein
MLPEMSWVNSIIFVLFVWSGFVRTGLGFGGALLSMPFILLVDNRPLVYLPIIAAHLLLFSPLNLLKNRHHNSQSVNWRYIGKTLPFMLPGKLLGVLGLVSLPSQILTPLIYGIVSLYGLSYLLQRPIKSPHPWCDRVFLVVGAYISGTSLIGGPLIMAVYACHLAKEQLRDTLFVVWFVLVSIKMLSFVALGVDLQLQAHLWLLPAAALGHWLGEVFHQRLSQCDAGVFYQVIGAALLLAAGLGVGQWLLT